MAPTTPLTLLVLLGSALVPHASVSAVSCLDESGSSIDYFSMMKYNNGADYDYLDASSTSYKASSNSLESTTAGAAALTLNQVYSGHSSLNYAMWNDEDSSGSTHSSRAHSKGVIAYDEDGGFWLTHSVPRYPNTVSQVIPWEAHSHACNDSQQLPPRELTSQSHSTGQSGAP